MKNLILLFAVAFVVSSCNMSYEKTKSGIRYKIVKGKGGEKVSMGDFVKFNQVISIPEKDTVLATTYGKLPVYVKLDTARLPKYYFFEIFPMMKVGDSAVTILSVDSLLKNNMIEKYDDLFRRGGQITIRFKILKKYATEQEMMGDYNKDMAAESERRRKEAEAENAKLAKEAEAEVATQRKSMEEYFKKNNINVIKTPKGAYVQVIDKGSGPMGDSTMDVTVTYTGKFFKDDQTFDSNGKNMGLRFSIGHRNVVEGLDDAMVYFGKGGKGVVYFASDLGYGPQANGPIPANSPMKFEIMVADLQKRTGGPMPMPVQVDLSTGKEVQPRR